MAKVVIDEDGIKRYFNDDGALHREDGPAEIYPDGTFFWRLNGKWHRENGPAYITIDGIYGWRVNGSPSKNDGPSFDNPNGNKVWFNRGYQWPKL